MSIFEPYLAYIKWGAIALALASVFAYGHHKGAASVQAKFDAHLLRDAQQAQAASEAARKHEQQDAANSAKIADAYEQGKRDAEAAGKSVADGLRAGTVKLRHEWQGCEANRVSGAAPDSPVADDSAQRRADGAGRAIAATHDDAVKIKALQELLRAERGK